MNATKIETVKSCFSRAAAMYVAMGFCAGVSAALVANGSYIFGGVTTAAGIGFALRGYYCHGQAVNSLTSPNP